MSEHISVGSVSVDVVPNVERFARDTGAKLDPEARRIGDDLGKILGDALARKVNDAVGRGLRESNAGGTAAREGARTGEDFGGAFARIAKARIAAALHDLPEANIDISTGEADAKLEFMRVQLAAISGNIDLGVDDTEALAKLEELKLFMEHELRDASSIRMRVNISEALAKVAVLAGVIDAANAQAAALSGVESVGGGGGGGAAQGGGASGFALPQIIETGPAGISVMTAAVLALIALAPAITVAAGVISAAILGMVAALSAATLGFGALVVGGIAVVAAVVPVYAKLQAARTKLTTDQATLAGQKTKSPATLAKVAADQANIASLKAQLGPGGEQTAVQIGSIGKEFSAVGKQLLPTFLPLLSAGLRLLSQGLTFLAPITKAVVPSVVGLLNAAGRALAGPQAKAFVDFIIKNAPHLITDIGRILGNVLGFIFAFIQKFTPLGTQIFDWLSQASTKLASFFKSENFTAFLAMVKQYQPVVTRFLGATVHLIGNILAALVKLAPVGAVMLTGLSLAFEALGPIIKAVADAIVQFFLLILHGLSFVLHGFANVAHFLHLPFADALSSAATAVDNFTSDFQSQVDAVNAALDGTLTAITQIAKPHFVDFFVKVTGGNLPGIGSGHSGEHSGSGTTGNQFAGVTRSYGTSLKDAAHQSTGGLVTGQGTGTSDSIPRWLSNGEYVMRAASVAKYGTDMMRAVNDGTYPTPAADQRRTFEVNAYGFGANEVADAIVRKQQNAELLHGRR